MRGTCLAVKYLLKKCKLECWHKAFVIFAEYASKVERVSEVEFLVPSSRDVNTQYTVHSSVGICSCKQGSNGSFCKHQVLVYEVFGVGFPNIPAVNCHERHQLGLLALEEKCPQHRRFLGLGETETEQMVINTSHWITYVVQRSQHPRNKENSLDRFFS